MPPNIRFPVLGVGAVCTLGVGVPAVWDALLAGAGTPSTVPAWAQARFPCTLAFQSPVPGEPADTERRGAWMLERAIRDALYGLPELSRGQATVGLVFATMTAGSARFESAVRAGAAELDISLFQLGQPARACAASLGLTGPVTTISTACAGGTHAILLAQLWLAAGWCDFVIAAGLDLLSASLQSGFVSLRAVAKEAPRPLTGEGTGFLIGEAAAAVLLGSVDAIPARPYVQLVGTGATADAYHLAIPRADGCMAAAAMQDALYAAGIAPSQVAYVNAHGTGTARNDAAELRALRRVFSDSLPGPWVGSTKGATGHCQSAAGVLEAIFVIEALRHGVAPPMPWVDAPQVEQGFRLVGRRPEPITGRVGLSATYGFGGGNAVAVFEVCEDRS